MKNLGNFLLLISVLFLFSTTTMSGQDDLLDILNEQEKPATDYTIATFKSTRLVSGHSVETNAKGVLQFLIGHRFGRINDGWRNLFGLDNAIIRLGFDYGITDRINIGIGRSSFEKVYDATFKWKFLRQQSGATTFPITATLVSSIYASSTEWSEPDRENFFSSRLSYHHSLLLARKFGNLLSLQLMPTVVHRNLVPVEQDDNTIFALGAGTSVRLTGSLRLNLEYYYVLPDQVTSTIGGETVKNSFSIGVDLETGGHVFQLHLTNSRGMTERYLVGETTGDWFDGDIHFGFNVSRVFTVRKPKEFKK
ncbi:DUF5777 family beta-barrel protein [Aquimarina sp. ERC-38]|uniref:DUF5777 family beta-barrel protein n=1 Tax=Aquimarina sp. ERC-38 TaxID=2949996 RepID=UPI002245E74F|nr:DUF5777 family beta-barrel protein [Aquimarina sp. ERC-38]UZO81548.1 DUF5777 family beta-barrel protein [Aquimarina sp. ERC-38]